MFKVVGSKVTNLLLPKSPHACILFLFMYCNEFQILIENMMYFQILSRFLMTENCIDRSQLLEMIFLKVLIMSRFDRF